MDHVQRSLLCGRACVFFDLPSCGRASNIVPPCRVQNCFVGRRPLLNSFHKMHMSGLSLWCLQAQLRYTTQCGICNSKAVWLFLPTSPGLMCQHIGCHLALRRKKIEPLSCCALQLTWCSSSIRGCQVSGPFVSLTNRKGHASFFPLFLLGV